jgi:hypothetical protein
MDKIHVIIIDENLQIMNFRKDLSDRSRNVNKLRYALRDFQNLSIESFAFLVCKSYSTAY